VNEKTARALVKGKLVTTNESGFQPETKQDSNSWRVEKDHATDGKDITEWTWTHPRDYA
jgi:hypothetical protein